MLVIVCMIGLAMPNSTHWYWEPPTKPKTPEPQTQTPNGRKTNYKQPEPQTQTLNGEDNRIRYGSDSMGYIKGQDDKGYSKGYSTYGLQ